MIFHSCFFKTIPASESGCVTYSPAMFDSMCKRSKIDANAPINVEELLKLSQGKAVQLLSSRPNNSYVQITTNLILSEYSSTGISYVTDSVIAEYSGCSLCIVDVAKKKVLRISGYKSDEIEPNRVLDLNDEGERWEGDVLEGKPCGWGVLYDTENRILYEGFSFASGYACFGRKYYSDIQQVEYEGSWCEGMRWGRGIQYDRTGKVVYDGEWIDDEHMKNKLLINSEMDIGCNLPIHNWLEEIEVGECSCCYEYLRALNLHDMTSLKRLVIRPRCFANVIGVMLADMPSLESVLIEDECFTMDDNEDFLTCFSFGVKRCPRLTTLDIGSCSFPHYSIFQLEDLPSLKEISIAPWCFRTANLILKGVCGGEE